MARRRAWRPSPQPARLTVRPSPAPDIYCLPIGDDRDDLATALERLMADPTAVVAPTTDASELRREMYKLRGQLDEAFQELFDRIDVLDTAVQRPAVEPELPPLDLTPLDERLAELDAQLNLLIQSLGAHLAADRHRIEASLTGLAKEITALASRPMPVNTRGLEAAVDRGALHSAADIANLRNDVEALTHAVRLQDKNLGELRGTLDWIKERLLLR